MNRTFDHKSKMNILFFNASAFKETCYLLLGNIPNLTTDSNSFSSIIVNGMLAIEIYLKFLIAMDAPSLNNNPIVSFDHTHNIYDLYKELSPTRQKEIIKELHNYGCTTKQFYKFRLASKRAFDNKRNNKFKNGDPINWRYLIVNNKLTYKFDINTMVKIIEVLYKLSQKIINDLHNKPLLPSLSSPALDEESEKIIKSYI